MWNCIFLMDLMRNKWRVLEVRNHFAITSVNTRYLTDIHQAFASKRVVSFFLLIKVPVTQFFSLAKVKLWNTHKKNLPNFSVSETELVRGLSIFLGWCHKLIYITLTLYKHACKTVCDINSGIDPGPSKLGHSTKDIKFQLLSVNFLSP